MTRRAWALVMAMPWLAVIGADAQQPAPRLAALDPPSGFLTSAGFHLGVEALSNRDARFDWDGDFGGDVDVVDFGAGRLNAALNYELVMGGILQPFDPIYHNYAIGLLGTVRVARAEVGLRFEHVSRHLGDRPKAFGLAWNALGAEVGVRRRNGRHDWQLRVRALGMIMRDAVDYTAELGAEGVWRYAWRSRAALFGAGTLKVLAVEQRLWDRGSQTGARVEGGVHLAGSAASLELFAAAERRVDPDPMAPGAQSWVVAGFRVVNR
jgi:hypothetical protein